MKSKWIAAITVASLFLVPFILRATRGDEASKVQAERAGKHEIKASILASGNLVYEEQALLSPEVIGRVSRILVKEGDRIERGQLVMMLDDQVYRAQVEQQEASVRQQRVRIEQNYLDVENRSRQYERQKRLHQAGMIADQQVDDSNFAVRQARNDQRNSEESLSQAQALLRQYREQLEKTKIRAPISGTVTAMDIKVGETAVASQVAVAGSSLMTIANTSTINVEVNVDEADISRIVPGQKVTVHMAAYPDDALEGSVSTIPLSPKRVALGTQSASGLARSYVVKVHIDNPNKHQLRPGMTCRAEIFTSSPSQVLAVPLQAIMSNNVGGIQADKPAASSNAGMGVKIENHVFVIKDGKAQKRLVRTGLSDDLMQEVVSGLALGETVITGPYTVLRHMKNGQAVSIDEAGK